uniref:Uncharacterized protein n=1 Tax=Fagus sylvatica TaxID=28930 RepID=A0A2N9EM15_FAGSY
MSLWNGAGAQARLRSTSVSPSTGLDNTKFLILAVTFGRAKHFKYLLAQYLAWYVRTAVTLGRAKHFKYLLAQYLAWYVRTAVTLGRAKHFKYLLAQYLAWYVRAAAIFGRTKRFDYLLSKLLSVLGAAVIACRAKYFYLLD